MEILRRNTDYAIRALVYLAAHSGETVSAGEIAASQEIPLDFLQKILQKFVQKGVVTSNRGAQGGFALAKAPQEVRVLDIVETMQGKLAVNRCFLDDKRCPRASRCPLKQNWLTIQTGIEDFLAGITLQTLVEQVRGAEVQ